MKIGLSEQSWSFKQKDGLGLGLAIVRELLEANGGSLKLSKVPTGGLRCVVTLPLALEDEDELR